MAWSKPQTPIDAAVTELQRHWIGMNLALDDEKVFLSVLGTACCIAETSACRGEQTIAEYASSLLWAAHQIRTAPDGYAHGMLTPLPPGCTLAADPMAAR